MATWAGIATFERIRHAFAMVAKSQTLESLKAQERITLIGRLGAASAILALTGDDDLDNLGLEEP